MITITSIGRIPEVWRCMCATESIEGDAVCKNGHKGYDTTIAHDDLGLLYWTTCRQRWQEILDMVQRWVPGSETTQNMMNVEFIGTKLNPVEEFCGSTVRCLSCYTSWLSSPINFTSKVIRHGIHWYNQGSAFPKDAIKFNNIVHFLLILVASTTRFCFPFHIPEASNAKGPK